MADKPGKQPPPPAPKWAMDVLIGVAATSLLGMVGMTALGIDSPAAHGVLIMAIAIAGACAIILHARRVCAECGTPYGYRFRISKTNLCFNCGAEFVAAENHQDRAQ